MGKYILIAILANSTSGEGVRLTATEFNTKQECEIAAKWVNKQKPIFSHMLNGWNAECFYEGDKK